ncbi:isocitrate lyase/PEP mutase family protein [Brevundimonas bacteroides]|uniref:isocitrate lyase/PEP mutase family protein n=1 Tax=Brevundimonas bacteroides TaxID=74311 RepID=UPI000494E57F|nr:isocitrate lyase/phosphoenolpyruvate mutase family protein [Brevundimonas bacteroides]
MPVESFRRLHQGGLLILPNAWDAASAALSVAAGAKAVATTSAGVAWALGWPDGARPPEGDLLAATARIVRAADGSPVSADVEGGFSEDPGLVAAFVQRVADVGVVGINIEDGAGPAEVLAEKIAAIRAAMGGDLFVNARCDLWLRQIGPAEGRLEEAARRAALYREAGADGLFMPGVTDEATARALVGFGLPLNLLARAALPDAATLEGWGVRRLSAGSNMAAVAYGAAEAMTRAFLADGRSGPQIEAAFDYGALNALMSR